MTYFFDVYGTLVGNVDGLEESECAELLNLLRACGNNVIVWSSAAPPGEDLTALETGCSEELAVAAGRVVPKRPASYRDIIRGAVVVDDQQLLLGACRRMGAHTVHASEMRRLLQELRLEDDR